MQKLLNLLPIHTCIVKVVVEREKLYLSKDEVPDLPSIWSTAPGIPVALNSTTSTCFSRDPSFTASSSAAEKKSLLIGNATRKCFCTPSYHIHWGMVFENREPALFLKRNKAYFRDQCSCSPMSKTFWWTCERLRLACSRALFMTMKKHINRSAQKAIGTHNFFLGEENRL